ncbi:MAG TPA: AsmA-like C-terminal region-containing protein, partial [Gammaproteobacteria bacterium]
GFVLPLEPAGQGTFDGIAVPSFLLNRTLRVVDSVVTFADRKADVDYRLEAVNLALHNRQRNHSAYLSVSLPQAVGKRFEAALELRGDLQNLKSLNGRFYVQAEAVNLPVVLQKTAYRDNVQSGLADFALWVELDPAAKGQMQGNINLQNFAANFSNIPLLSGLPPLFDLLSADFQGKFSDAELELELENLLFAHNGEESPVTGLGIRTTIGESAFARGEVMLDFLRLEDVARVALQYPSIRVALDKAGIQSPVGNLFQIYGRWDRINDMPDITLLSYFEGLGITGRNATPSVDALSGRFRLRNNAAVIDFATTAAGFYYPKLFRNTHTLHSLQGSVFVRYNPDASFTVAARDLFLQTPHIVSRHWFDLQFAKNRAPYVDAYVLYEDGDLHAVRQYIPAGVISPKLLSWLDEAIVSGKLTRGDFELRGPLDKFPFRHNEGILRIDTDFENMELNYFNNWSHLQNARLHTRFSGSTLAITVHEGRISDIDIIGADAWITDFGKSHLILQADGYGPLQGAVRYLRETGLRQHAAPLIDQIEASGMQASFVRMDIPLYQGPAGEWNFNTSIFDGGLRISGLNLEFSNIKGDIRYSRDSISAAPFTAVLNGFPINLNIATFADAGGHTARISMEGDVAPGGFVPQNAFDIAAHMQGPVHMLAAIDLPLTKTGVTLRHPAIGLLLDTTTLRVNLPPPFYKEAGTPGSVAADMLLTPGGLMVDIDYADWLDGKLFFQSGLLDRADIRIGGGKPKLPPQAGIFIKGRVDELDIDRWLALRPTTAAVAQNPLQRLDLRVDRLTYRQHTLRDTILHLIQKELDWVVGLESKFISGSVAIPKEGLPRNLAFDLEYFNFDETFKKKGAVNLEIEPADIPPFNLQAERIVLKGWDLREVGLEVTVDGQTLNVSNLRIDDPDVGLEGSVKWTLDEDGVHHTETNLVFNSQDIGGGLGKFGYAEIIRDGAGTAEFDLSWRAAPTGFNMGLMHGKADLALREGQVLNIKPGGGRLFGLLSVQTIPRRLAFDFKDVFAEGFRFDKMKGHFDFRDGNAYTDNYYIDGPAGRIDIQGRVGMVKHDYDQKIQFRPDLSSSLPIVGTLLGGASTGLALIVADRVARLFGKEADDLARLEYTLTGSWDEPVITPVKSQQDKTGDKKKNKTADK